MAGAPTPAPAIDPNDLPPGADVNLGMAPTDPAGPANGYLVDRPTNPPYNIDPTQWPRGVPLPPFPVQRTGAPVFYKAPAGPPQPSTPDVNAADLPPEADKTQPGLLQQILNESFINRAHDVGSVAYSSAAGAQHLVANTAMMLDHAQSALADMTGMDRGTFFKGIEDWARAQQQYGERKSLEQSGGRQDFNSQLFRTAASVPMQLPVYGVATAAAGGNPILGMAGLSALETADQGPKAALTAAAEGAAQGGMMEVMGPAGRPIRLAATAYATYKTLVDQGVPKETALANALGIGTFAAMSPGELSTGQTLKTMTGNPFAGLADPQKLAENQQAAAAAKAAQDQRSAEAQRIIDLGKKYNVTLTAGDISQAPSLKNVEIAAEKVPGLGMQTLREKQAQQVKAAASDVKSQYGQALLGTDPSSLTELQEAAQGGDQRARNVMDKMQAAGNDPDRIIQASIGLGDWTTRQTSTKLYDQVQNLAEQHDLGDVPMDTTGKAIEGALNQLRPAKLKNNEVINLLQKIKESVSPQKDAKGKPVKPDNSYGLIRQLHSDLGDRIREYYQGNNALIGEKGVGYLERVQNALEDDMRNYAQNSNVPEIVQAGKNADEYYKTARVPYKNGMLAAAATSSEPDQVFQQFIKAGKKDRAQNFYDSLDEKGRAAVRYNMVAKAVDDAINPQSGIFSPQKFFTAVDKLGDAYDVFFTAKDKAEIQGFKKLMGHVTRAGQYAENPPTGQRAIPYIVAGEALRSAKDIAAHPFVTGGAVALLGGARALLTTVRGRNLLLRAYGVKPGSPMMKSIWQDVANEIGKGRPPEEPPAGPGSPIGGGGGPQNPNQPASGVTPAVTHAENIVKGIDPENEKILYHSSTADQDPSIRENWLTPKVGDWVRETIHGATDEPETIEELLNAPGLVYLSDTPSWVTAKVARKLGKHVRQVTRADVENHGQLSIVKADLDDPIVRKSPEDNVDDKVLNLRGEQMPFWQSDVYDYDKMREIPIGVERGDYFTRRETEPATTLTGKDLVQFLERNHPDELPAGKSPATGKTPTVDESAAASQNTPAAQSFIQRLKDKLGGEEGSFPSRRGSPMSLQEATGQPRKVAGGEVAPRTLKLKPTGEGGALLTSDLGKALEDVVSPKYRLGKAATREQKQARALESMIEDVRYALAEDDGGRGWYTDDVAEMERRLAQARPEFRHPEKMALFKYLLGITSNGVDPETNFNAALKGWDMYRRDGRFSAYDPSKSSEFSNPKGLGLTFRANSYEGAMNRLTQLVNDKGEAGASEWLQSKHPVSELRQYYSDVPGKAADERYGSYIFGEKVGAFGSNLNGIHTELTADKWWSRTWNRWMGTMMDTDANGNVRFGDDGNPLLQDAPRNETERNLMRETASKVAAELGLNVSELQAVLWYAEQRLYRFYGIDASSTSYADAAQKRFGDVRPAENAVNRGPPESGRPNADSGKTGRRTPKVP